MKKYLLVPMFFIAALVTAYADCGNCAKTECTEKDCDKECCSEKKCCGGEGKSCCSEKEEHTHE